MQPRRTGQNIQKTMVQKLIEIPIKVDETLCALARNNIADYSEPKLISVKESLNRTKSQIDKYYATERVQWQSFERTVDTYRLLKSAVGKVSNAKHVTNAWLKYWELYNHYGLPECENFTAFFNAELPGAALCAFNHYAHTVELNPMWYASSLVDTTGDALGDIYGIYKKNREHWLMNSANNGDVTVSANITDFTNRVPAICLYSHDAGIDASNDFNNQETMNAKIHFGCAIIGLKTLSPGGTFIAKQYTFFETFTWNLILLYASLFGEFYICKPLTSRPNNSEIYMIGKNFKGLCPELEKIFMHRMENFSTAPFIQQEDLHKYSQPFEEIQRAARIIYGNQEFYIRENISLFEQYKKRLDILNDDLIFSRNAKILEWLKTYPVPKIGEEYQLASNDKQSSIQLSKIV